MISVFQMNKLSFISLETSLTHGISGFQLFGEFPVAFLVLISGWISLGWRTHNDLNYFYFPRFVL